MSGFYLASESSSPTSTPARRFDSDFEDDDDLPYPQPLRRDSFLQKEFDPSAYLSEYIKNNRHQTLSDLRNELRERSQKLQQELLDLVNAEYQAFLTLGADLKGGEEKVEGVRVGVLGFVNGVSGVKEGVRRRREEVESLVKERERISGEKETAKQLIEVHTRIGELEDGLQDEAVSDEEDEDGEEEGQVHVGGIGLRRLRRLMGAYVMLRQMIEGIGREHPFMVKQEERVLRIRNTLLLDLGAALRQAKAAGAGHGRVLKLVSLYAEMGEEKEGIKVLRDSSSSWSTR